MSQIMDAIVIGCGASGIAALAKLHEAGLKVLGLEAADRIGGRICTVEFGAHALDLGAAWCHGEVENVVFELANPHGLLEKSTPDDKWYIKSNGEMVAKDTGDNIVKSLDSIIGKADKNNTKSISEILRTTVKTNAELQKDQILTNSFIEWYERNSHVGGQRDPQSGKSLKGLDECWNCAGDIMLNWKGKGYRSILDLLLKKIPDPSQELPVRILKNKEVEVIKWKHNQSGDQGPLVQVQCKDGSSYAAKRVLVTLSVGVLKERHHKLFNPPLPSEKVNTINNLQMCVLNKIYVEFEKPWWSKTPANFNILWRSEDKEKFSNDDKWLTEIYGFITVEYQPNVLLAWIYGEGAEQMEKFSIETVKTGIEKLIKVLFGNNFQLTPVKSILRTQWSSNPLIRGSYSYRSVGTEINGGSAAILSEPLYHGHGIPIVCFGGEASSHHRHGAAHGAIEAGLREADRIIQAVNK